jgi:hypothetical protein
LKTLFLFSLLLYTFPSFGQAWKLKKLCQFPAEIHETSGIEIDSNGSKWTHNDSGSFPYLYQVNDTCGIVKKVWIKGIDNTDIEDIAFGSNKKVFIGDIGNNTNDRKNLQIYETHLDSMYQKDSISVRKIKYSYPDQVSFPPLVEQQNFDCEAFFHHQNNLYLFSKNRGTSSYTKCYKLNPAIDSQVVQLLDSFPVSRWLTSADISPSGQVVALISEFYLTLFYDFVGDDFFGGKDTVISTSLSQKEGVVFANDTTLFFTDEKGILDGGYLYQMPIPNFNKKPTTKEIQSQEKQISYPYCNSIYDMMGRMIYRKLVKNESDKTEIIVPSLGYIIEEENEGFRNVTRINSK